MTPEKPDANMTYVIREQEHCSAGIFTLDADIKLKSDTFYAYYPRTANDCCMTDEAELSLVLPAVQTYKKNSFATNANIAVAVSTDGREYAFRNACSYLNVKLQGDGIVLDKIVITAGKDTSLPNQKLYLAGSGKVCFNDYDSEPVFELDGSSDNNRSITLNCDNVALEADAPTDFYFVMPAGTYSGITVDVYTADGQKISYVKGLLGEGLVFERNTVNSFKVETITTAPTDEVEEVDNVYTVSTPQQWNWLAAQVDTGNTFEGKTIALAQNLDFTGIEFISMGMEADYMTDTSLPLHPFQGTIEGNEKTISNVNLSSDGRACGIIGYGRECTVRNLTLSDITVTGAGKWKGALVGYLWNGTVENVHVINALIHPYEETLPQEPYRYSYRIGGMIGFWSGDKDAAISNVSIRNAEVHGSYAIAGLIGGIQGAGKKNDKGCRNRRHHSHQSRLPIHLWKRLLLRQRSASGRLHQQTGRIGLDEYHHRFLGPIRPIGRIGDKNADRPDMVPPSLCRRNGREFAHYAGQCVTLSHPGHGDRRLTSSSQPKFPDRTASCRGISYL